MDDATGKVVLVTGAGKACGRVIAQDFAARGAQVVVNDVDEGSGTETVEQIVDAGGVATFVRADVGSDEEVAALFDAALDTYGRLDISVHNAGIEFLVDLAASTPEQFSRIVGVNLAGARNCTVHAIRAIRAGGRGGAILNMSSVTSDIVTAPQSALYGMTKGGISALTKGAAIEVCAEGISINALAFIGAEVEDGMFQRYLADTGQPESALLERIPIGRTLKASELCAAVRYLTSDDARFVVGTTFVLDGGFTSI